MNAICISEKTVQGLSLIHIFRVRISKLPSSSAAKDSPLLPGQMCIRDRFRTLARLRNHFDIATLPRYDLAGQIQANAHTLLFVYFFLTDVYKRQGCDRQRQHFY